MQSKLRFLAELSDGSDTGESSPRYSPTLVPAVLLRADAGARKAKLAEVIAAEIAPRLNMIHHRIEGVAANLNKPEQAEIAAFGQLAMRIGPAASEDYFSLMREKGYSTDTLFVHFLAPTARYLGELWDQDRCDFVDVSIGVAHLQELLTRFELGEQAAVTDLRRRALLATPCGEKHKFGIEIVAKFLGGAGWDVTGEMERTPAQCAELAASEWFGIAGLTISSADRLEPLARTIEAIRAASCNRSIGVMVGGPLFNQHPEYAALVGADSAAADAPTAVILAKRLLLRSVGAR